VVRLVSQPSAALALQSPKPAAQVATVQRPPAHPAVALGTSQAVPQPPQLRGSPVRSTSQPLVALRSQSPRPALHVARPHTPATQAGVPPATEHAVEQLPQWAVAAEVHLAAVGRVGVAVGEAVVAAHDGARPARAGARGVGGVARAAAGSAVGGAHPQVGLAAVGLDAVAVLEAHHAGGHARPREAAREGVGALRGRPPQEPQLAALRRTSVSQPLVALPSQSPKPVAHERWRTPPPRRRRSRWGVADGAPQAPQWVTSTRSVDLAAVGGVAVAVGEARVAGEAAGARGAASATRWRGAQAMPQPPQWATARGCWSRSRWRCRRRSCRRGRRRSRRCSCR
jgi:hypothetical protein